MDGLHRLRKNEPENIEGELFNNDPQSEEGLNDDNESSSDELKKENKKIERESFLDKLTKNLQDFLDNAE
jgi:hypothetical protein